MCELFDEIKLCSCSKEQIKFRHQEFYKEINSELVRITDKRNDRIPLIFIWRLFRLVNENNKSSELGRDLMPTKYIGKGLNQNGLR